MTSILRARKELLIEIISNIENERIISAIESLLEHQDFLNILDIELNTMPVWVLYEGSISSYGNKYINRIVRAYIKRNRILEAYAYYTTNIKGNNFYKYDLIFIKSGSTHVWYRQYENLGFYNLSKYYQSQEEAEEDIKENKEVKYRIERVIIER